MAPRNFSRTLPSEPSLFYLDAQHTAMAYYLHLLIAMKVHFVLQNQMDETGAVQCPRTTV
jgi:hypothetical protein